MNNAAPRNSALQETSQDGRDVPDSRVQPVWHVGVLVIFTMFGYGAFWFFKTWRDLADYANASDDHTLATNPPLIKLKGSQPILLAVGNLIPVLQLFLTGRLFTQIAELVPDQESFPAKHPMFAGLGLLGLMYGLLALSKLQGSAMLLFLLSAAPLMVAQLYLNKFWREQEKDQKLAVRYAFSAFELTILVIGACLLGLIVTNLVFGVAGH